MIVNRRGLEAGHFHFEHAHTIILKDGVEAVIRLRFHRGAARGMVYIKIIFRNLSHEGSSDEQEEQREKNILGPHGTSKNVRGALGRENRVQTILPPDNTVADVLSIEQCCRSMIFRFWGISLAA